jgi:hypothetical protein
MSLDAKAIDVGKDPNYQQHALAWYVSTQLIIASRSFIINSL